MVLRNSLGIATDKIATVGSVCVCVWWRLSHLYDNRTLLHLFTQLPPTAAAAAAASVALPPVALSAAATAPPRASAVRTPSVSCAGR
jgi:hypothetical protein